MLSPRDILLFLFCGLAVFFDCKEKRIPNWLNFLAIGAGLLLHSWGGFSLLLDSLYGCGLGIGLFLLPFIFGWLGAGDVKLMGALGAILGSSLIPRVAFYAVLAGSLLALCALLGNKPRFRDFTNTWRDFTLVLMTRGTVLPESVAERSHKGAHTVPYGAAIVLGALIAVYYDPDGHWAGF